MLLGIDASRALREEKTGVEWYSAQIIRAMLACVPSGWDVRLYDDNTLRWPPRYLWTQFRLPIETTLHPPDVLFIPGHVHPFVHPRKTVVVIHDVAFATHPEAYTWKGRAYLILTTRWAARTATRIIVPTLAVKDDLVRVFGARSERVRIISHGPGIIAGVADVSPRLMERRLAPATPGYFISVGRLETKKNTPRLVRAFLRAREMSEKVRAMELLLVGKPGRLRETIPEDPSVVRVGYAERYELARLLSGATALLFPSLAEGFGLPIVDGMTFGVPVLTSKGGATEEVAGGAAVLVIPTDEQAIADSIVRLAEDVKLRDDLSIKGRARSSEFSWDRAATATWDVIREAYDQKN